MKVKVAYILSTTGHTVSYKLGKMILPQLEEHRHGAEVVGMFFFDDNTYALRRVLSTYSLKRSVVMSYREEMGERSRGGSGC